MYILCRDESTRAIITFTEGIGDEKCKKKSQRAILQEDHDIFPDVLPDVEHLAAGCDG